MLETIYPKKLYRLFLKDEYDFTDFIKTDHHQKATISMRRNNLRDVYLGDVIFADY
jgi:hypothetical protein